MVQAPPKFYQTISGIDIPCSCVLLYKVAGNSSGINHFLLSHHEGCKETVCHIQPTRHPHPQLWDSFHLK